MSLDEGDENEILSQQFADIFARITKARDQVLAYGKNKVSLCKDKLDLVRILRQDINAILDRVYHNNVHLDASDRTDLSKQVIAVDDIIESIAVIYFDMLDASKPRATPPPAVAVAAPVPTGVKIPHISVPVFSGDIKDFPRFYKLFDAVYGRCTSLTHCDRFYYLQSLLRGEALTLVEHYPLSDQGYVDAIKTLKERYECPRTLAAIYMTELFTFSPSKRATPESLKKFLEVHNDNVQALKSMPGITDLGDLLLLHLALRNLDLYTRRLFENQCSAGTMPLFKDLISFVSKTQHSLSLLDAEKSAAPSVDQQVKPPARSQNTANRSFQVQNASKPAATAVQSTSSTAVINCIYCNSDQHKISRCSAFFAVSLAERISWVKSVKRCLACFSSKHLLATCSSNRNCIYCKATNHNSALCPNRGSTAATASSNTRTDPNQSVLAATVPAPAHSSTSATSLTCKLDTSSNSVQTLSSFTTMLGTIVCHYADSSGFVHEINVLLDTGSQKNLISLPTVKRLGLRISADSKTLLTGIGNAQNVYHR